MHFQSLHTKAIFNSGACHIEKAASEARGLHIAGASALRRSYSKQHGRPERERKSAIVLRRLFQMTWEEQWGAVDPYNFVTVEQYLEDMHHVLNDRTLKKKAHRWLPYLFKAVDSDRSGFISIKEFKLFYECLGLSSEQAAVAFAVIDTNGEFKLFYECLGLSSEQAAVAFAVIDTNGEFKLFYECLGVSSEQAAVAFAVIDTNGEFKLFYECLGLSSGQAAVAFAVIDTNGVTTRHTHQRQGVQAVLRVPRPQQRAGSRRLRRHRHQRGSEYY
ncbi:Centrin [Operophtera brumata]|uniref:Centrin n=1 Tax=Operophtera brumata TaxID=104452 RepID=A0A0L7LLR8_OPEBR|nr:Centrin [Operophtera brumata]